MHYSIGFVFILVVIFYSQSLVNSTTSSKCSSDCDVTPELFEIADFFVSNAFVKANCVTGSCNYCEIAAEVKRNMDDFFPNTKWVVLLGADRLLVRREEFSSKHNREPNSYILYTYKQKHDVAIFRPKCKEPVDPPGRGKITEYLYKETVFKKKLKAISGKSDFNLKFPGSSRTIIEYKTDMSPTRTIKVWSHVNKAFDEGLGDFNGASLSTYNYLNAHCPGEWVVLVAGNGKLDNPKHFCAAYERYSQTSFNATYEAGHNIEIFSPKC